MEVWIHRAAVAFVLVCGAVLADAGVLSEGCRRISAGESILIPPETCSVLDVGAVGVEFMGVVEGEQNANPEKEHRDLRGSAKMPTSSGAERRIHYFRGVTNSV